MIERWNQVYTFKEMDKELIVESIKASSREQKTRINLAVLGYAAIHLSLFGYMKYKEKKGKMDNFEQWVTVRTFLRRAKIGVVLGWLAFIPYNHYWYLNELKELGVYEYMTKRARLEMHMSKVQRMW